jgi:hypothetical protein
MTDFRSQFCLHRLILLGKHEMADMQKMEHWLGDIPSPQTPKNYRSGIKGFEEYYGKPIEELLKLNDEELGHEINKYYSWLKQSHPQNTCRNQTNAVIQFLKHFGKNPKTRTEQ